MLVMVLEGCGSKGSGFDSRLIAIEFAAGAFGSLSVRSDHFALGFAACGIAGSCFTC